MYDIFAGLVRYEPGGLNSDLSSRTAATSSRRYRVFFREGNFLLFDGITDRSLSFIRIALLRLVFGNLNVHACHVRAEIGRHHMALQSRSLQHVRWCL